MKLLITGSRKLMPGMALIARRLVTEAGLREDTVLVGDAEGIDEIVIKQCKALGVAYIVYGITPRPRNGDPVPRYVRVTGTYLRRDEVMVDAADTVVGVWNGQSRGTKYTCDYARLRGKLAKLHVYTEPEGKA